MNYPTNNSQNGWQIFGNALQQGGRAVEDYQTAQTAEEEKAQRLKMLMEDMALKKQEALLAKIKADREAKLEADKESRAKDFRDYAAGPTISPALAANPSLSRASRPLTPGGPTQAELDDLGAGLNLPAQQVSGQDSTAMLGAALERQPLDMANGRISPTRDELFQKALATGQMTPAEYGTQTKPVPSLRDRYKTDVVGKRKVRVDLDTGELLDLGPAPENSFSTANKDQTSPEEIQFWAEQYADGKVDPATLSGMFSSRGGGKANIMGQIVRKAQGINKDVNVAKDAGDFASSKNQKNRGTVATIDNVSARMDRILELSSSIDRTNFPTLNKWLLSGAKGVGNMRATMLKLNEDLTGEELNQVFGGGTAGSDAKLKLAQEISSLGDLPVDVATEKIKEIRGALETRKTTFKNQMGRFGGRDPALTAAVENSANAAGEIHLTGAKALRLAELRAKAKGAKP